MSPAVSPRQETKSWIFWAQFLAGPVLWSVHFLASYLLVETFCQAGWSFRLLGMPGLSFLVLALTLIAAAVTVGFALRSYRGWRSLGAGGRLRDRFRQDAHWFEGPAEFMYFGGLLLSALFAVVILMVGLPALFLRPC